MDEPVKATVDADRFYPRKLEGHGRSVCPTVDVWYDDSVCEEFNPHFPRGYEAMRPKGIELREKVPREMSIFYSDNSLSNVWSYCRSQLILSNS